MPCSKHIQWIHLILLVTLLMGSGCENSMQTQTKEQAAKAISSKPSRAALPVPLNLLSNEPDYRTYRELSLEHPDQMSLEFLQTYSPKWVEKSKDIDAQIAQISDPELREAQKKKLQAETKPALFQQEAIKAYDMAAKDYQLKRIAFFNAHQNQWVEIAQYYDYTTHNQIVLFNKSIETAATSRPSSLEVDIPVMDKVFSHFKTESQQDIDSAASEKWQQTLKRIDPNEFYSGFSQYEIDALVAKDKKEMWKKEEVNLRRSRLMLMVQGDIIKGKYKRMAFVNQITGSVLYEFPSEMIKNIVSESSSTSSTSSSFSANDNAFGNVNNHQILQRFHEWLSDLQTPGVDLSGYYADEIRYYTQYHYSKSQVLRDKAAFYQRYPSIELVVHDLVANSVGLDSWELIYNKDYTLVPKTGASPKTGRVRSHIIFKQINGEWLIVSEWDQKG